MGLFNRKKDKSIVTKEEVERKAEALILAELSPKTELCIYTHRPIHAPAPAREFTRELLEETIKAVDIKEKIDNFVQEELLEKVVKRHVESTLNKILKQDLIEEIVVKINKVQVRPND